MALLGKWRRRGGKLDQLSASLRLTPKTDAANVPPYLPISAAAGDSGPPFKQLPSAAIAQAWANNTWAAQSGQRDAAIFSGAPVADNPPPKKPYPEAIFRAWQPDLRVTILRPPGGGGTVSDVPPNERTADATIRNAWRQDWAAQSSPKSGWNSGVAADNPPPKALPKPSPLWVQEWRAQTGPRSTWNVAVILDLPPPKQDYWLARVAAQWQQTWAAQSAPVSTAWDTPPVGDQPPAPSRQLDRIIAQWQPNYSVTMLRPVGGGSVEVVADNPPARVPVPPQIAQAWQQTWSAQTGARSTPPSIDDPIPLSRPRASGWDVWWPAQGPSKNAAWNVVAAQVDNPPPKPAYPIQVFRAWDPVYSVTMLRPVGGGSVVGDAPPPRQDYGQQRIAALWKTDWPAQSAAKNAGWNYVVVTPDDPPFGKQQQRIPEGWYQSWKTIEFKAAGEISIADDPPPKQDYAAQRIAASWQATWKAQGPGKTAAWNFTAPVVNDPPFRQDYGLFKTLSKWVQTWPAQTGARSAAWDFTPAVVDNPPPLNRAWLYSIIDQHYRKPVPLEVRRAAAGASSVDDPPPKQDYAKQQIVASWNIWWPAQGPGKSAAWNYVPPVIDNPPPRNNYAASQIVASWQQNWLAQSKTPIGWLFPEPPVVVVTPPEGPGGPPEHRYPEGDEDDASLRKWLSRNKRIEDGEPEKRKKITAKDLLKPKVEPAPEVDEAPPVVDVDKALGKIVGLEHVAEVHARIGELAVKAAKEKAEKRVQIEVIGQADLDQEEFDEIVAMMMLIAAADEDDEFSSGPR